MSITKYVLYTAKVFVICICFSCLLTFPGVTFAQVKINEFVVDPNPEWVELANASSSAQYLKNYFLDDDLDFSNDTGSSAKKSLADIVINNPNFPYISFNSFLNNSGDWVVLFDPNGNLIDSIQYTSSFTEGVSMGRSQDQPDIFTILTSPTQGAANSLSLLSPSPTASPVPTRSPTSAPASANPTKTPLSTLIATAKPNTPLPTFPSQTQIPVKVTITPLAKAQSETPSGQIEMSSVLGVRNDTDSLPTSTADPGTAGKNTKMKSIVPLIIFITGTIVLVSAGISFWYLRKREKN